jgi:hypothetical protein
MTLRSLFRRVLARVQRVSQIVRRIVLLPLLFLVYVLVLPFYALTVRLRRRPRGWIRREDQAITTPERLRRFF